MKTIAVIAIVYSPRLILMTVEAPYKLIILKQCFPVLIRKTIVRMIHFTALLTIIDSDAIIRGKECCHPIGQHWIYY